MSLRAGSLTVGGAVSTQIRNRAILAVAIASVGILLYMAYAFRNTQNPLLYGSSALGPNDDAVNDVAVMDDFIYGEPIAIPEPCSAVPLVFLTLAMCGRRIWKFGSESWTT